jgi:hypothetical protein
MSSEGFDTCCGKTGVTSKKRLPHAAYLTALQTYITNENPDEPKELKLCAYGNSGLLEWALHSDCFVLNHGKRLKTATQKLAGYKRNLTADLLTNWTTCGENEALYIGHARRHHQTYFDCAAEVDKLTKQQKECLQPTGSLANFVTNHSEDWYCYRYTQHCNNLNCKKVNAAATDAAATAKFGGQ